MFKYFDQNRDGKIDLWEWSARIYEDSANPLALIREIVQSSGIDSDDLLHKMGLRIWDDPIDLPTFNRCMWILDPTLTETQLKALAKEMKNNNNRVDVIMML